MQNDHIAELEKRINALEGKFHHVDKLASEVAHCRKVEEILQLRLEFEEIVTEITTEFINLLPGEIDLGINKALAKVGEFVGADRCYVFQFSEDGKGMSNTHEYCVDGINSRIAGLVDLPSVKYQWTLGQLREVGTLLVGGIKDFPAHAEYERREFENEGLKAFVVFALNIKERLIGFVGFDWINKECDNLEHVVALLKMLGVVIANTIERQRLESHREETIAELRQKQERLLTLSIRDELTGLYNRRHMEESLTREISRALRHKTSLAIIMLDLDYFKRINDNYGHMAGDLVLVEVGRFLGERSRGEDVVCRYGGEEFVIIMPGASLEAAMKRAEDICREAPGNMRVKYREKNLPDITVSLGVAAHPEHGETSDLLLYNADSALYQSKKGGRNKVTSA